MVKYFFLKCGYYFDNSKGIKIIPAAEGRKGLLFARLIFQIIYKIIQILLFVILLKNTQN